MVIERGANLIANGTISSPIVWKSVKQVGFRNQGDWGGIIILGNAPLVTVKGAKSNTFFPNDPSPGKSIYGGSDTSDNSGSVSYNRVEFAGGFIFTASKQISGFTLAGVGSGTIFHHNEVASCGNDGFGITGGTINVHHLFSFGNKDDDYAFDEAYTGNLQFIIAYRNDVADSSGSFMIETQNNSLGNVFAGSSKTTPFIANATLIGASTTTGQPGSVSHFDGGIYLRKNGRLKLANSLIITQARPSVISATPSTIASLKLPYTDPESSPLLNNIFQNNLSSLNLVFDGAECEEPPCPSYFIPNPFVWGPFGPGPRPPYYSTFLPKFSDFKLGDYLNPLQNSPALSGGINLSSLGFNFMGTLELGTVISTDTWTSQPWISRATH